MRITKVISHLPYLCYNFIVIVYCFQIHKSYLLETELSLRVIVGVDYQL
jgi:hypothetical protein